MPLIEARSVHKSFRLGTNDIEVLRGVDLSIDAGKSVSIVGASGSGKSTLLNILGTLEKPNSGDVLIDGQSVAGLSDSKLAAFRNRTIGFVFQFHHLLPEFTAIENVMLPQLISGASRTAARKRAADLIGELGIGHRLEHRPGELSGGEQQRVALARALANEPRLLLADEPTGNLDARTADGIHNQLLEINREQGLTLLLVTHNPDLAESCELRLDLSDGVLQTVTGAAA